MKKTFCIFLCALLCLTALVSCKAEEKAEDIRKVMFAELMDYYAGKSVSSYLEAASLYAAGKDLKERSCTELFKDAVPDAEYVISYCILKKAGASAEAATNTDKRVSKLLNAIDRVRAIDTITLYKTVAALELYGAEYDRASVARSLAERQDEVSGGSYEYPQSSGSSSHISDDNTAASFMTYLLIRDKVGTRVYDDTLHDSALEYFARSMNDNNTFNNYDGVQSSVTTARVLTAFIASGFSMGGEDAIALLKAIHSFAVIQGGALYGYRETANAEGKKSTASEILFCVTCTLYGNPFLQEKQSAQSGTENQ